MAGSEEAVEPACGSGQRCGDDFEVTFMRTHALQGAGHPLLVEIPEVGAPAPSHSRDGDRAWTTVVHAAEERVGDLPVEAQGPERADG